MYACAYMEGEQPKSERYIWWEVSFIDGWLADNEAILDDVILCDQFTAPRLQL